MRFSIIYVAIIIIFFPINVQGASFGAAARDFDGTSATYQQADSSGKLKNTKVNDPEVKSGVELLRIRKGGPLDEAGLASGDLIIAFQHVRAEDGFPKLGPKQAASLKSISKTIRKSLQGDHLLLYWRPLVPSFSAPYKDAKKNQNDVGDAIRNSRLKRFGSSTGLAWKSINIGKEYTSLIKLDNQPKRFEIISKTRERHSELKGGIYSAEVVLNANQKSNEPTPPILQQAMSNAGHIATMLLENLKQYHHQKHSPQSARPDRTDNPTVQWYASVDDRLINDEYCKGLADTHVRLHTLLQASAMGGPFKSLEGDVYPQQAAELVSQYLRKSYSMRTGRPISTISAAISNGEFNPRLCELELLFIGIGWPTLENADLLATLEKTKSDYIPGEELRSQRFRPLSEREEAVRLIPPNILEILTGSSPGSFSLYSLEQKYQKIHPFIVKPIHEVLQDHTLPAFAREEYEKFIIDIYSAFYGDYYYIRAGKSDGSEPNTFNNIFGPIDKTILMHFLLKSRTDDLKIQFGKAASVFMDNTGRKLNSSLTYEEVTKKLEAIDNSTSGFANRKLESILDSKTSVYSYYTNETEKYEILRQRYLAYLAEEQWYRHVAPGKRVRL